MSAASRMTCEFAPPYPKELTPARLTGEVDGQARFSVTILMFHSSSLIFGLMDWTPTVGGISPFSNARTTLMMLEIPLAASLHRALDLVLFLGVIY